MLRKKIKLAVLKIPKFKKRSEEKLDEKNDEKTIPLDDKPQSLETETTEIIDEFDPELYAGRIHPLAGKGPRGANRGSLRGSIRNL